jgi:hypothetical protein
VFSSIEKTKIVYKNKEVVAHKLIVRSKISINLDTVWSKVQTSELFEFITKGKVKFFPTGGKFPEKFIEGQTIGTKMVVYGFIPFGGLHTLYMEKIDQVNCKQHNSEPRMGRCCKSLGS